MLEVIVALIGGILLGIGLFYLLRKGQEAKSEDITETIEQRLEDIVPKALMEANDYLVRTARESLTSETKQSRIDLENKRKEIERMVKSMDEYLKEAEKERIDSYATLKSSVEESRKITEQLSVNTENLKNVLSDNQVRGQFGERVADDLLKMAGFVKGVDYEFNKQQEGSKTRPDFAVFLPDGTRINVDSKFPYASLQKMSETEDNGLKKKYMKDFERDVKEKIKQVTSRDYINPEDKTVDFVILFIPNEMIFSYIYDKMPEISQEAMENKVILAGPFSFTAILRMIRQSYENFRVQKNIYTIINHVKAFEKEFDNFSGEFYKIGDRISSLQKQYDVVSSTRFNQLVRKIDKVKEEGGQIPQGEQKKLLEVGKE
jgi:DNA recombination protein RmuC